jgi:helix-turn-helix protein
MSIICNNCNIEKCITDFSSKNGRVCLECKRIKKNKRAKDYRIENKEKIKIQDIIKQELRLKTFLKNERNITTFQKNVGVFATTPFKKLIGGTRVMTGSNGNNAKNWVIRSVTS